MHEGVEIYTCQFLKFIGVIWTISVQPSDFVMKLPNLSEKKKCPKSKE